MSLPGSSWNLILEIYKSDNIVYVPTFINKCFLRSGIQLSYKNYYLALRGPLGAYLEAPIGLSWTYQEVVNQHMFQHVNCLNICFFGPGF